MVNHQKFGEPIKSIESSNMLFIALNDVIEQQL